MIYKIEWKIKLYKTLRGKYPVLDYVQSLLPKQRAKIESEIDLLEQHGIELSYPHAQKIKGNRYKDLWELRIKLSKMKIRILYFLCINNIFILLHAFPKKSQKL